MKTITINVSEPVYRAFKERAKKVDRTASELIREAMEEYRQRHLARSSSLRDRRPASVGGPVEPLGSSVDLLDEMLNGDSDDLRN